MRILVVGATGTIGRAVVAALSPAHEVVAASRTRSPVRVDITSTDSVRAMYREVGSVDAVVGVAGDAKFAPLASLTDEDFAFSLGSKLMGQVRLVRWGLDSVRDAGSFTLTSGVLAREPIPGTAAISLVNSAIEGFARAAALDSPRGIRVNAVSPPWVDETLRALGMDASQGLPVNAVARAYVESVTGRDTGAILEPRRG